jgi:hypothetical protein
MNQRASKIYFAAGLVGALLAGIFPSLYLPYVEYVHNEMGIIPTDFQNVVFRNYAVALICPFLVLATWRFWPSQNCRGIASLVVGTGLFFAMIAFMVVIGYISVPRYAV